MSGIATDTPAATALYRKVAWRIMPLLVVTYVVAFIDRTNIGFAKLGFMGDLKFGGAVYGFGAGIFYLGYVLLEIPSNLYLHRVGARKTLLRIMLLWGACCTALALVTSPAELYVLRFLLGAAEAGLFPGILLYLTYWIPAERRAGFTALFMAAIPVAGIIGGPLAGAIMHGLDGRLGLHGWQWLFVIEGLPAILLGVVAYLCLDNSPAAARWLSGAERSALLGDLERDRAGVAAAPGRPVIAVLRDPMLYKIALFGSALMISTAGAFLWLPTIIHKAGIKSLVEIGLLTSIPFTVGVVAQILVSRSSDRRRERRWHAVVPALAGALGWGLLPLAANSPVLSIALQTVAISGTFAAMGPFWTVPGLLLTGSAAAAGVALVSTIAGFGNFISPIIVSELAELTGSLGAGQIYFAVLLLLGSSVLLFGTNAATFARARDVPAGSPG
jgi:MFS family permease